MLSFEILFESEILTSPKLIFDLYCKLVICISLEI